TAAVTSTNRIGPRGRITLPPLYYARIPASHLGCERKDRTDEPSDHDRRGGGRVHGRRRRGRRPVDGSRAAPGAARMRRVDGRTGADDALFRDGAAEGIGERARVAAVSPRRSDAALSRRLDRVGCGRAVAAVARLDRARTIEGAAARARRYRRGAA